jgi:hypothetical protein
MGPQSPHGPNPKPARTCLFIRHVDLATTCIYGQVKCAAFLEVLAVLLGALAAYSVYVP